MEQLAIFGGTPVREQPIYYGRQSISKDDITAVEEALTSRLITCGPRVSALEEKLKQIVNAKYAVVVSNGTAALHLAAMAAGITEGDEVITTPMTFAASANCVRYCGGTVVFADIDPKTYNIDPDEIEKKITSRTKAVIAVDYTGQAIAHDRIDEICKRHGLLLIEDAAHAIGTKFDGKPVGSIADMTCFSFHPVKTVTSGEGGAVTTNDPEFYRKLLLLRSHGITTDAEWMTVEKEGHWFQQQIMLGYNYRITDFQAALLNSQLSRLSEFSKRRKELVAYYDRALSQIPEIIVHQKQDRSDTTWHLYIIQLVLERLNCTRRQFFDAMAAENVNCQVHYIPVYYHPYYQQLGYPKGLCPNAERLYERILSIPLYPDLTDADAESVVRAIQKIVAYYRK